MSEKIWKMSFREIYALYQNKVERKGRTKEELDAVLCWLTGHDEASLKKCIESDMSLEMFVDEIPALHPNHMRIKGSICGVKIETIEDEKMRILRYMDKLVDELAKGKAMEKIIRV